MLLYVGGDGNLNLHTGGVSSVNVLFRIRDSLLQARIRLIYVDRPIGQHARGDTEYARAAAAIIERENSERLPVFVAGISRGSISAANVAARVPVAGMILLSTVTGSTYDGTVRDTPVSEVSVPSLLLLHKRDACVSSGSESALRSFATELKRSRASIVLLDGGMDEAPGAGRVANCHPKSHHGFNGIEPDVAKAILTWLEKLAPRN